MTYDPEPRRGGLGGTLFAGVLIALMGYLALAALQGEHGLFSLLHTEGQEARLKVELSALQAERLEIANKSRRLSEGSLDIDLLDEQARRVLGYARADERIVE